MHKDVDAQLVGSFREALAKETGLRFDDDKAALLADLLSRRSRDSGAASAAQYVDLLAGSPRELAELARDLSVPETYFLRNRDQYRVLATWLRERARTPDRRLGILSAGCSTGEEAYSAAIVVLETVEDPQTRDISILGVDLNPDAIARARANSYSRWSMRATSESIRRRYFHESDSRFSVDDDVRRLVRFQEANLLRPPNGFWKPERFDVIFCRNVLMYMTPDAARRIVGNIAHSLRPGGCLFLGHAENLRGLSHAFHLRRAHETFYYQLRSAREDAAESKVPAAEPRTPALWTAALADASWFEAITEASSRIEGLRRQADRPVEPGSRPAEPASPGVLAAEPSIDRLSPAKELMRQERFTEALRLLADVPRSMASRPDVLLLRAMLLVSTGEVASAIQVCDELLAVDDLNAGAHYILAICLEHGGDLGAAVEHNKISAYLDQEFAMPHLHLGRIARRAGQIATARCELELALGLLPMQDAAGLLLFGGGFNREALVQICRAELAACGEAP